MKKIVILILLMIIWFNPKNAYSSSIYHNFEEVTTQQELYKGSLLSFLYPYISRAVEKYYGYPKQYDLYDAKIISIKKTYEKFEYEIIVQVETFTDAHNPPMGIETITVLTSPMGTKVTNFNHISK